jgi:hypothetical protein
MYYPIKFLLHPSVFGVPPVISSPFAPRFEGGAPPRVERLADRSGAGGAWGFNKKTMERSTIFNGKTHYFYGIFYQ